MSKKSESAMRIHRHLVFDSFGATRRAKLSNISQTASLRMRKKMRPYLGRPEILRVETEAQELFNTRTHYIVLLTKLHTLEILNDH